MLAAETGRTACMDRPARGRTCVACVLGRVPANDHARTTSIWQTVRGPTTCAGGCDGGRMSAHRVGARWFDARTLVHGAGIRDARSRRGARGALPAFCGEPARAGPAPESSLQLWPKADGPHLVGQIVPSACCRISPIDLMLVACLASHVERSRTAFPAPRDECANSAAACRLPATLHRV